jgi:uncharacterized protein
MERVPPIELLERTHRFPCPYMFKAIGKVENGFAARLVAAVRDELAAEVDPPFRVREAVGGRHVAVSIEPVVQTAQQVLAVYQRISKIAGLVFVL